MKNRLIIIGKNLYLNRPFMEYVERELEHLGSLEQIIHIFNIDEEGADALLDPLAKSYEVEFSSTTLTPGWLMVECSAKKFGRLENFLKSVKQLMADRVIESTNIMAYLIHRLSNAQKSVTFAESCTGGRIASKLTSEAGSSAIFKGSLVTYSNALKAGWLGVEKEVLEKYGAVSRECVEQMLSSGQRYCRPGWRNAPKASGNRGDRGQKRHPYHSGDSPFRRRSQLYTGAERALRLQAPFSDRLRRAFLKKRIRRQYFYLTRCIFFPIISLTFTR